MHLIKHKVASDLKKEKCNSVSGTAESSRFVSPRESYYICAISYDNIKSTLILPSPHLCQYWHSIAKIEKRTLEFQITKESLQSSI